jgi:hypothetical protein
MGADITGWVKPNISVNLVLIMAGRYKRHEGCDYFVAFQILKSGASDSFTSEPLARHLARTERWTIDDDGDFCPRHSEIWEIREI